MYICIIFCYSKKTVKTFLRFIIYVLFHNSQAVIQWEIEFNDFLGGLKLNAPLKDKRDSVDVFCDPHSFFMQGGNQCHEVTPWANWSNN